MPISKQSTKLCYVIMPFSKTKACAEEEWTDIFDALIKPAVEGAGLGYSCRRSEATTGNIIKKIVNSLYVSNVVIADLTDRNPNVFYELGVRHTLQNRTIMIAQRRKDIPSDLDGYASHVYKWKTTPQKKAFAKKIAELLQHIDEDVDRSDNPVADFLHERSIRLFEFQREETSRKLRALIDELGFIREGFEEVYERRKKKDGDEDRSWVPHLACPALDHFIATQYLVNGLLTIQARATRSALSIMGDQEMSAGHISDLVAMLATLERNAKKLLAAYESGDALDDVELESTPSREPGGPS